MKRYRIGYDITVLWAINDRNGAALPLTDKEVHLYYTNDRGRHEAKGIEIQDGNVVAWTFRGKEQRTLGSYTLTLEILQPYGTRTIKKDYCGAFALVGRTCEESESEGDANINGSFEITLASDLDIYRIQPVIPYVVKEEDGYEYWYVDGVSTGKRSYGKTAYEIAVEYGGYEGTEQEFAEYLAMVEPTIKDIVRLQNRLVVLSETEYEALEEKDSEKFYFTYEEDES